MVICMSKDTTGVYVGLITEGEFGDEGFAYVGLYISSNGLNNVELKMEPERAKQIALDLMIQADRAMEYNGDKV